MRLACRMTICTVSYVIIFGDHGMVDLYPMEAAVADRIISTCLSLVSVRISQVTSEMKCRWSFFFIGFPYEVGEICT